MNIAHNALRTLWSEMKRMHENVQNLQHLLQKTQMNTMDTVKQTSATSSLKNHPEIPSYASLNPSSHKQTNKISAEHTTIDFTQNYYDKDEKLRMSHLFSHSLKAKNTESQKVMIAGRAPRPRQPGM